MGKFYSMRKIRAQDNTNIGRIDIYGEISAVEYWGDEKTPSQFIEDLNNLGTVSEIEIHIFSNGGDPFAALAIYEEMNRRTEKVSVYIDGIAASAATLILCGGDTVYMNDTSMLMVHNPYEFLCFAGLNAKEARELADDLDEIREPMISAYMKKSGKTHDEVVALMDGETGKGTWLTADAAIEFGLVDSYTPDNKKPLEVAAMIKPGVYNYRGHKVDLTSFEKAAEKTAGKINSMRGGKLMAFFIKKKNKAAAKVKPKAEITFVEMVCPGCGGAVNLNPETGETFAGGTQQTEPQGGKDNKEPAAKLARRIPGNVKATVYSVNCPHCGNDFVWDTDLNADGEPAQDVKETVPIGGAAAPEPKKDTAPVAEAATAVCPKCSAEVQYDTETAEKGTDDTTGEEGYLLTCPECNEQFIEPFAAPAPDAVPVASAEAKAAYRAGVLAERNRNLALDEMAQAAPSMAAMIQAAKKSGASAEIMGRNVIRAMASGKAGNTGAAQFAAMLGRDLQASGVNDLRLPGHHNKQATFTDSVFDALDKR